MDDAYDKALTETINGFYKAEVIHRQSRKSREAVALATLTWGEWFNQPRHLEPIGHGPRRKPLRIDNSTSRP